MDSPLSDILGNMKGFKCYRKGLYLTQQKSSLMKLIVNHEKR